MTLIRADFGGAAKDETECRFSFMGILYHLKMHEDGHGKLLGIDLTCPSASKGMQGLAAEDSKWISGVLDCGVPLSSMYANDKERNHGVYGHAKVKRADTVTDAVLQILVAKYESAPLVSVPKNTNISFLQVLDGGRA